MKTALTSAACSFALLFSISSQAATPAQQLQQLKAEVKSGTSAKLSSTLLALKNRSRPIGAVKARAPKFAIEEALGIHNGYIYITAHGSDPKTLRTELEAKGLINGKTHANAVTGRAPVERIGEMAGIDGLAYMKESMSVTWAGAVTSQGDMSMYADLARQHFDVDGTGVRIGVLSDSFNCRREPLKPGLPFTTAEDDIASGELPADIRVLAERDDCGEPLSPLSDEGRAMMQIIHDVAPGATLSFHAATTTEQDFAAGILELAADGAQIIVDDIGFLSAPVFENGVAARAVNTVKQQGVTYFSSAGNQGWQAYDSVFRPVASNGAHAAHHDFDAGEGVDTYQHLRLMGFWGSLTLSWDEPSLSANGIRGSASDLDIVAYDMQGNPLPLCQSASADTRVCQFAGIAENIDADATETLMVFNGYPEDGPVDLQISVQLRAGPAPTRIKHIPMSMDIVEHPTRGSTLYGHANAEGAEAVAAGWWFDTAAFGAANHPICNFACIASYSSIGGTPLLFDDKGERRSQPYIGLKPGITAPDGGNTTFFKVMDIRAPGEPDAFPNFFGTSAAAPHVAAVAALMLDQRARDIKAGKRFNGPRELTPDAIISALRMSAHDITHRALDEHDAEQTQPIQDGEGFDLESGYGMVNALQALELIKGF